MMITVHIPLDGDPKAVAHDQLAHRSSFGRSVTREVHDRALPLPEELVGARGDDGKHRNVQAIE